MSSIPWYVHSVIKGGGGAGSEHHLDPPTTQHYTQTKDVKQIKNNVMLENLRIDSCQEFFF